MSYAFIIIITIFIKYIYIVLKHVITINGNEEIRGETEL